MSLIRGINLRRLIPDNQVLGRSCLAVGPGLFDFHSRHGRLNFGEWDVEMNLCTLSRKTFCSS